MTSHWVLRAAAALAAGWIFASPAQTSNAQVSGSFAATGASGDRLRITFTCTGIPTCSGTFTMNEKDSGCSNSFTFSSSMVFNGLDISHPGTFSGSLDLAAETNSTILSNGTCSYSVGNVPKSHLFTGTWDGVNGVIHVQGHNDDGSIFDVPGTFTSNIAPSPVFPMTVTANVTPTVSSASATIQPRPQDVGSTESVYVFVHAPSNLVQGAKRATSPPVGARPEDDAVVCVLAQVDSGGHLVAVSASTMQALLTGVISSQGQAVSILNNVPTPNVAGAAVYVGYGSSAAAMLSSGVYQNAVSVPGTVQCTASLASAPAPLAPGALTGLWWGGASESGWGIHFTQRGADIFAAWYTYDSAGNPKWYVAPNCAMPSSNAVTGTCAGSLYEVDGPRFFGVPFITPTPDQVKAVGTLQVNFQSANAATMSYTLGSQSRTVPITRQSVGNGTLSPAVDYSDLWWDDQESGWGIAMAQQSGNVFLAWYVYGADGKPIWYVASNCTMSGSACSGTLYRTTGPAFGPTFNPSQVQIFAVGSVVVSFIDANNGVLSYTVDGVSASKPIKRQVFPG